jgi:hypothetical protein
MAKRCCRNCVYALRPTTRWLRVLLSHSAGLALCFNCAACPGTMQEVYAHAVCRNFRARRWPAGMRDEPPEPKDPKIRYIPLTQGEVAMVDAEDYEELSKYKWYVTRHGGNKYACRCGKRILMHRVIMKPPRGMVVDHIDGNGLNNRRCNLRICTHAQNACNRRRTGGRSGFRGVEPKGNGKYAAIVGHKRKRNRAGVFSDPIEAARARDKLARELHGEYAWVNLPGEVTPGRRSVALSGRVVAHSAAKATLSVSRKRRHPRELKVSGRSSGGPLD